MFATARGVMNDGGPGSLLVLSTKPKRRPQARAEASSLWFWFPFASGLTLALILAQSGWYTVESDFAYWIGAFGGSLMLLLFLYPARKRFRWMESTGAMKFWFGFHIFVGIGGPFLIVVHSTLAMRSMNALIAFICMCLVAGSGVIGRFIYVHVHRGMSVQKDAIEDLTEEEGDLTQIMKQRFANHPELQQTLETFERETLASAPSVVLDFPRLFKINISAYRTKTTASWMAAKALRKRGRERRWKKERYRLELEVANRIIDGYVNAVVRLAQFTVYEKLFAMWHFVHVPLAIVLLVTAIWHVVAVHMY
jgi:hypothetical protein